MDMESQSPFLQTLHSVDSASTVRLKVKSPCASRRCICLILVLIGIVSGVLVWVRYKYPEPPGPTPPGASTEFDSHLQDIGVRYSFIFIREGRRIEVVNIDGIRLRVLLDLSELDEGEPCSAVAASIRLSPDGRHALVPFSVGKVMGVNHKLLVLDVRNGLPTAVEIPNGDFKFDGGIGANTLCEWLSNECFVISLTPEPNKKTNTKQVFLRYNIDNMKAYKELDLGVQEPRFCPAKASALIYGGYQSDARKRIIRVISQEGIRAPTMQEKAKFDRFQRGDIQSPNGPVNVRVDAVVKHHEVLGPNPNWDCYDIYFDKRWVRRSDSEVANPPLWDEDIDLYIWYEEDTLNGFETYYADRDGRYRRWHKGKVIGKIPLTNKNECGVDLLPRTRYSDRR